MKYRIKVLTLLVMLAVPAGIMAQHDHSNHNMKPVTLVEGLGDVAHPVSTSNSEAQRFFNQGLAYVYAFNHDEAIRSFRRAAELDPKLAMAHWGAALALGSNYNLQANEDQLKQAFVHLKKAQSLSQNATEHERAYITALSKRYSEDTKADAKNLAAEYKAAMAQLVRQYPDDLNATTLYAESMMNLRPWQLWASDGTPAEGTLEIIATLESVLKRDPTHTGANHYYIHAVEASPNAERALPSANRLGGLAPNAGHLVHMPSHIYIRTGDYNEAAKSNADAIVADRNYIAASGAKGVYPMMYYNHNIHFLAAAHAMNGNYEDAMKSARELEQNVGPHIKAMPMLEMFLPYTTISRVRFRKWDEVLKVNKPAAELKIVTAYWHFSRGLAFVETGKQSSADSELKALKSVRSTVPANAPLGNSIAQQVLLVAENVLEGKLALARGDRKAGLALFHKAIEAEGRVGYNEPPDWDLPVREWLGGELLAGREFAAAEEVFREELKIHPRNGRALFGLVESLKGQGKTSSAQLVHREFERAWKKADTKLSIEHLQGRRQAPGIRR